MALLLGVVGLYGVIAYSVSRRTREIGVRMALGAERKAVYRLILKEAGWLTVLGIVAGLLCSVAAASLMQKLLFGIRSWDLPTLLAVAAVLAVSALLASYIPARRAASVNPVEALRVDNTNRSLAERHYDCARRMSPQSLTGRLARFQVLCHLRRLCTRVQQQLHSCAVIPGVPVPSIFRTVKSRSQFGDPEVVVLNSSFGWNRKISRTMSAFPCQAAQCSAVNPCWPGTSDGHPASSIIRTAFVLLFWAALGTLRRSSSV